MKIQVFLSVGGENGILVKKIFENTFEVFLPKYQKLKIGTFKNQKNRGGENSPGCK